MELLMGLFIYIVIIFSATVHEYAHALAAQQLGDTTARDMGRLTLNPLKHIDMWGTVLIPLVFIFTAGSFVGWAKPVPYNPFNLRDKKYGSLKVAIAGPAANFCIAGILAILMRIVPVYEITIIANQFVSFIIYVNIFLGLFNLIPVPPLDGSKIIFDLIPKSEQILARVGFFGIFIALIVSLYIVGPITGYIFNFLMGAPIQ